MRSLLALSLFAFAAGCGHAEVPAQDMARTEASLRAAEEVGAAKIPQAALHVKMARDQLDVAKKFLANGETQLAQMALHRASMDAELAVALSREDETRRDANEIGAEASALKTGAP